MTNDDIKFYRGVPIDMHVKNCEAEIIRLRKIEDAAVKAVDSEEWAGDAFHERMGLLMDALRGE